MHHVLHVFAQVNGMQASTVELVFHGVHSVFGVALDFGLKIGEVVRRGSLSLLGSITTLADDLGVISGSTSIPGQDLWEC